MALEVNGREVVQLTPFGKAFGPGQQLDLGWPGPAPSPVKPVATGPPQQELPVRLARPFAKKTTAKLETQINLQRAAAIAPPPPPRPPGPPCAVPRASRSPRPGGQPDPGLRSRGQDTTLHHRWVTSHPGVPPSCTRVRNESGRSADDFEISRKPEVARTQPHKPRSLAQMSSDIHTSAGGLPSQLE